MISALALSNQAYKSAPRIAGCTGRFALGAATPPGALRYQRILDGRCVGTHRPGLGRGLHALRGRSRLLRCLQKRFVAALKVESLVLRALGALGGCLCGSSGLGALHEVRVLFSLGCGAHGITPVQRCRWRASGANPAVVFVRH